MPAFAYETQPDPIRADLAESYRRAWNHIAAPGTWLTGAERVAVAGETRRARRCALCRERKEALSPFSVSGGHEHAGVLVPTLVDAIHRITTDAGRLSETWVRSLHEQGLTPEAYVEAVGVAVVTVSIDRFHHALGLPLEPLPTPEPGEPTRVRPDEVVTGEAWVPMQPGKRVSAEVGLPSGAPAPFVIRALSLVPAEVKAWQDVSGAQYLGTDDMLRFDRVRAIDRSQIELVAGRVSALNECFY
jgi:alkylhydroperoxidase family enzyme